MAELRGTGEEGVGSAGALLGGRGGGQRLQLSGGSGVVRAAPLRRRGAGILRGRRVAASPALAAPAAGRGGGRRHSAATTVLPRERSADGG